MFERLSENHLDLLEQNLIVPLAVSDILTHKLPVEPEMQYGIHLALSEIDPDSAVLAIALCALHIAQKFYNDVPIAAGLHKEARDIIGNYAPGWIYHHQHGPMKSEIYHSVLADVPEDLEALADLMDALAAEVGLDNSAIDTLIGVLSVQARAHMEIADYILLEMEFENQTEESMRNQAFPVKSEEKITGDNIILFPTDRL